LDRVNHLSLIGGFLALSVGIALATSYAVAYGSFPVRELVWGFGAWVSVAVLAAGRVWGGWQARRAAVLTAAGFVLVLASYLLLRLGISARGEFL
jgi:hypothetical protein